MAFGNSQDDERRATSGVFPAAQPHPTLRYFFFRLFALRVIGSQRTRLFNNDAMSSPNFGLVERPGELLHIGAHSTHIKVRIGANHSVNVLEILRTVGDRFHVEIFRSDDRALKIADHNRPSAIDRVGIKRQPAYREKIHFDSTHLMFEEKPRRTPCTVNDLGIRGRTPSAFAISRKRSRAFSSRRTRASTSSVILTWPCKLAATPPMMVPRTCTCSAGSRARGWRE